MQIQLGASAQRNIAGKGHFAGVVGVLQLRYTAVEGHVQIKLHRIAPHFHICAIRQVHSHAARAGPHGHAAGFHIQVVDIDIIVGQREIPGAGLAHGGQVHIGSAAHICIFCVETQFRMSAGIDDGTTSAAQRPCDGKIKTSQVDDTAVFHRHGSRSGHIAPQGKGHITMTIGLGIAAHHQVSVQSGIAIQHHLTTGQPLAIHHDIAVRIQLGPHREAASCRSAEMVIRTVCESDVASVAGLILGTQGKPGIVRQVNICILQVIDQQDTVGTILQVLIVYYIRGGSSERVAIVQVERGFPQAACHGFQDEPLAGEGDITFKIVLTIVQHHGARSRLRHTQHQVVFTAELEIHIELTTATAKLPLAIHRFQRHAALAVFHNLALLCADEQARVATEVESRCGIIGKRQSTHGIAMHTRQQIFSRAFMSREHGIHPGHFPGIAACITQRIKRFRHQVAGSQFLGSGMSAVITGEN